MHLRRYMLVLIGAAVFAAGARSAHASDLCATFFWTGSQQGPVERYQPRYLIGEGLEDVHMEQIVGKTIHNKWSTQAASCIASSNHYGYFFHPSFNQTSCLQGESCFPGGTRSRRMAERLADILGVAQQFATPNADPIYQANLNVARASSYLVIDSMGGPTLTAVFYQDLVDAYDNFVAQFRMFWQLVNERHHFAAG